ncbi:MAG TPA: hypothetical protein VFE96_03205 [Candidatus Bathyarchaeia archaeon]|nr:hypothetical protein [Candidatus Bathyarchaeia archaeon]
MKIQFTARRIRMARLVIALVAISLAGYVAYAATFLTINNSGTVTIAAQNIQGITFSPPSSQPNCATQTTYSNNPSAMTWASIAQGASANGYICVKNIGGTGATYSVTTSVAPPSGITVTYNGTSTLTSTAMLTGQTSIVNVVVSVSLGTALGSFSYTTSIT